MLNRVRAFCADMFLCRDRSNSITSATTLHDIVMTTIAPSVTKDAVVEQADTTEGKKGSKEERELCRILDMVLIPVLFLMLLFQALDKGAFA